MSTQYTIVIYGSEMEKPIASVTMNTVPAVGDDIRLFLGEETPGRGGRLHEQRYRVRKRVFLADAYKLGDEKTGLEALGRVTVELFVDRLREGVESE